MNKYLALFCSLPKSLYVCFRCFDFKTALRLPVIVSYRVRVNGISRGSFEFDGVSAKTGMVRLGISNGSYLKGKDMKSYLTFAPNSKIVIRGGVNVANNFAINIGDNGELILGNKFSSNYDLTVSCGKRIEFGSDCLLGWHCTFIDGDGHSILNSSGEVLNEPSDIKIGNHVWIASEATCLKGAKIEDGCVIVFFSTISSKISKKRCVIAGTPAHIVKENVYWKQ